jgi:hypothetical protein
MTLGAKKIKDSTLPLGRQVTADRLLLPQTSRSCGRRINLCLFGLIGGNTGLLSENFRLGLEPIVQVTSVPAPALFEQLVSAQPNNFLG